MTVTKKMKEIKTQRVRSLLADPEQPIERRKQLIRDLWAGKPIDHVPVLVSVANPNARYSIREQFQDGDKQLESWPENDPIQFEVPEKNKEIFWPS